MIDSFLVLMSVLILGFMVIIPIYVSLFKSKLLEELEDEIKKKEKMNRLRKEMNRNKKGR